MVDGLMRCPGCGLGVHMVDGGCNVTTCRHASKHGGRYYYFCAHCKAECLDGESMCTSCPMHNDRETRVRVKARREREREWKAFLSLAARWEPRPRSADGCCLQCGHADTVNPTARPPPLCSPLVACGGCQSPPRPSCYYISFLLTRYALCDVRYVLYFLFSYI